jgi:hypothetical protein
VAERDAKAKALAYLEAKSDSKLIWAKTPRAENWLRFEFEEDCAVSGEFYRDFGVVA